MLGETCDRCGFHAYVLLMNEANLVLVFCKHHFEEHEISLDIQKWIVVEDNRAELYPTKEEVNV